MTSNLKTAAFFSFFLILTLSVSFALDEIAIGKGEPKAISIENNTAVFVLNTSKQTYNLTAQKISLSSYEIKLDSQKLTTFEVKNPIDYDANRLLDCTGGYICDFVIEMDTEQALKFTNGQITGGWQNGSAYVDKVFYVRYENRTYGYYDGNDTYVSYNRTTRVEETDLSTLTLFPSKKVNITIRFGRDTLNEVDIYPIIYGYAFKDWSIWATGGLEYNATINGTDYVVHVFNSTGYFNATTTITNACYMLVGGGGGGGAQVGGGGGAGVVILNCSQTIPVGNYTITIGGGGGGSIVTSAKGYNGGNTTAFGVQATGGGGGGSQDSTNGANGGNGGGGSYINGVGGTGIANIGFAGGNGTEYHPTYRISGGGGGSNQTGRGNGTSFIGHGGNGSAYDINGSVVYYAGGGGGANTGTYNGSFGAGTGGLGGGGNGAIGASGQNATFYGSGGGGGGASFDGGDGYSGLVVIRYPTPEPVLYPTITPTTATPLTTLNFNVSGATFGGATLQTINWTIYRNGTAYQSGTTTGAYAEGVSVNLANYSGFQTGSTLILQVTANLSNGMNITATNSSQLTISGIGLYLCNATIDTPAINYTFVDENSPSTVINATLSAIYDITYGGTTATNTSNATTVCVDPYDATILASAEEYVNASGYSSRSFLQLPQNYSNSSITRTLALLNASDPNTQSVIFTVTTYSQLPLENYTIVVYRFVPASNDYILSGIMRTNQNGQASGVYAIQTPKYNVTVYDASGTQVYDDTDVIFGASGTTPYTYSILIGSPTPDYYGNATQVYNPSYGTEDLGTNEFTGGGYCTFANATLTLTCTFNDSTAYSLNLILQNNSANNKSVVASDINYFPPGSVSVVVPSGNGNYIYKFYAYYVDTDASALLNYTQTIEVGSIIINKPTANPYGKDGWFLALIIVMVVSLLLSWSAHVMIIGATMSILITAVVGLITLNEITFITVGIVGFAVAMAVND